MPAMPADRRPAIWPWLVMPLITLALFYGLDRLKHAQDRLDLGPAQTATHTVAEP